MFQITFYRILLFSLFVIFQSIIAQMPAKAQQGPWLTDVTSDVNLANTTGRRLYFADVNNDKYPDLILHDNSGRSALQLFMNVPDTNSSGRMFVDTTEWANMNASPIDSLNGRKSFNAVLGDVNNDGHIDLLSCTFFYDRSNFTDVGDRCACLLNNGDGKFSLKENSGLRDIGLISSGGMALTDYNQDGNLDLYISTFSQDHANNVFDYDMLMAGNGDGTFTDVSKQVGLHAVDSFPMYGINIVDWNNDGHQDIAPSPYCRHGGDFWKNTGADSLVDVSSRINYNAHQMPGDNGQAMCQWAADPSDFDNDGDMDFYLSFVHGGTDQGEGQSTLAINHGADSNFVTSWAMDRIEKKSPKASHKGDFDAEWMDFNNDGLVDLVAGQSGYTPRDRIYFFQQTADHFFDDISFDTNRIPKMGPLYIRKVNKVQALDYDLDGDDDLMYCSSNENFEVTLMENHKGNQNNWLSVHLIPPQACNRDAIGARVYLYADTLTRMRDLYAGEGNMGGQSPFILNFGFGTLTLDSVKVRWPCEVKDTTIQYPAFNRILTIDGRQTTNTEGPQANRTDESLTVYPNPVNDQLTIKADNNDIDHIQQVQIYGVLGQSVLKKNVASGNADYTLDVGSLQNGWYMISAKGRNGQQANATFIKK
jgi:hypothetical protein